MGRLERLRTVPGRVEEGLGSGKSAQPELKVQLSPWDLWQNKRAQEADLICKMPLGDLYEAENFEDKFQFCFSVLLKYRCIVKYKMNPIISAISCFLNYHSFDGF